MLSPIGLMIRGGTRAPGIDRGTRAWTVARGLIPINVVRNADLAARFHEEMADLRSGLDAARTYEVTRVGLPTKKDGSLLARIRNLINLLRLSISPLPISAGWYAMPLRLVIGFGFMQHGYAKFARGPEDFIAVLHAMGLPVPFILGWATIVVELVGGLMILAGALIPLATVPMAIVLLVAIFTVHLPNGFSSIKLQSFDAAGAHFGQPGYETDLLYLAGLVALCFGGPGPSRSMAC